MAFQRTGILAAPKLFAFLAMTVTLPLAGPVHADTAAADLASVDTGADTGLADVTSALPSPEFVPIGEGIASYYGNEFAGSRTASGERFDPSALTAAHRTLPFGSRVQVTNEATGDSVIVTINDRGPFHGKRLIDLSEAAAKEIGLARAGHGRVQLALLSSND
ncbi:septal ring lytic transglycosylase RlpA family protein [Novosphingobium mangrovi (ex Huang et al. 2023)]|uniref:Endolytic peptidoglycan transglycosylase RlpA n=1 Tax=Novosphingobium mangrovi (ex Huang et al. 2023) TaxID=2976432 RepID=A0ABT2I5L0_9SPHN|nr:septal ring lytic transglycosylase RlpA family protein [Novosphingobium mangrovi (ex Huang et al. 2023)]MCT2399837.1 septal ring lytic transglycosylase RlpA family protein [Novosphingobium mangrovi (ex Huang et al. 2023)]